MVVKVVAELLIFMAVIKFEVIFKELLMLMLIQNFDYHHQNPTVQ